MTFKKIIVGIIERESRKWVESVLDEQGFHYKWTDGNADGIEFSQDEKKQWIHFFAPVSITLDDYSTINVKVGGFADDAGIVCATIWSKDSSPLWANNPTTRKALGISALKLS